MALPIGSLDSCEMQGRSSPREPRTRQAGWLSLAPGTTSEMAEPALLMRLSAPHPLPTAQGGYRDLLEQGAYLA